MSCGLLLILINGSDELVINLNLSFKDSIILFFTLPISTQITVYPTFENDDVTCTSASQTFTITVNPTTNVTSFDDQFIFTGDTTESVTIESSNFSFR